MKDMELVLARMQQALATFDRSMETLSRAEKSADAGFIEASHDPCIKKFEYCYDDFWKLLKRWLEARYNVIDANSPRKVFSYMVEQGICTEAEGDLMREMAEDRNRTVHTYDEGFALLVLSHLKDYGVLMRKVITAIQSEAAHG